jgi:hypothetical protein
MQQNIHKSGADVSVTDIIFAPMFLIVFNGFGTYYSVPPTIVFIRWCYDHYKLYLWPGPGGAAGG